MAHAPAPWRKWIAAACLTLALNYAWEMGQARWYTRFAGRRWYEHARTCLLASLGDLVLAAFAYLVTAAIFTDMGWAFRPHRAWHAAVIWIALGLGATLFLEQWAVAKGYWGYTAEMPAVLGVALLPLLQWVAVPAATLVLIRQMTAPPDEPAGGRR